VKESSRNIWATSVIFKNLPKENSSSIGQHSLNLFTLITSKITALP
jgi:hypothetical protein